MHNQSQHGALSQPQPLNQSGAIATSGTEDTKRPRACEAAIDTPQSYFDDVIAEYKGRRDTLITELNKIEGVIVTKPKGAFYCIAQLPIDNADDFAQWLLETYDLNGETVMVCSCRLCFHGLNFHVHLLGWNRNWPSRSSNPLRGWIWPCC